MYVLRVGKDRGIYVYGREPEHPDAFRLRGHQAKDCLLNMKI